MSYRIASIATCLAASGAALWLSEEAPSGGDGSFTFLRWDKPPARWEEAFPAGNGKLALMVFGQPLNDRLQLAGGPYDPIIPDAKAAIPEGREFVNERKFREAAGLTTARMMAKPFGRVPYQTVDNLMLAFPESTQTVQLDEGGKPRWDRK